MSYEEKMRDELLAFQAAQRDILRWKLIAVGAVGAAGLGLAPEHRASALLIASLLPLIALFCDVVYRDSDLRVAMIASFLRKRIPFFDSYQQFVSACAPWANIGWLATLGSSLLIAIGTIVGSCVAFFVGRGSTRIAALLPIATGCVTLITAPILDAYFLTIYRKISETPLGDGDGAAHDVGASAPKGLREGTA